MKMISKIGRYVTDKDYRILVKAGHGMYDSLSDQKFLELCFPAWLGYKLDLESPKTFNEKMQWLKLHDRKEEYSLFVDKYEAKKIVEKKVGSKYIIPTIGIWETPDEIDFDTLPQQFVLKCNHNSGVGMCICSDKKKLNIRKVKKNLRKGLKQDYYLTSREWPYKHIKRKIIAEKYMVDESGKELKDYKVFCFNGNPQYIQVDFGRFSNHERNLYSLDWEYMGFASLYPTNKNREIARPECLEEMIEIAKILSKGTSFMRVDLYVINNSIFFGEMTLFHGSGFEPFVPFEWDRKLGDLLSLNS